MYLEQIMYKVNQKCIVIVLESLKKNLIYIFNNNLIKLKLCIVISKIFYSQFVKRTKLGKIKKNIQY